ncbi:MAG TPA: hypothetical protein VFE58_19660 [Tepidisphaeraceae bacterium]|jgi:flagellar basal-body rod protein FlgC|nr:hypothetical protein [Tepidisphaeraceae bacterium]
MCPKQILIIVAAFSTITIGCCGHGHPTENVSPKWAFEQKRVEVAFENIININTTRDSDGKNNPYRRKIVQWHSNSATYSVVNDPSPFLKRYEPGHPDADSNGFVQYPNVDLTTEAMEINAATQEMQHLGVSHTDK